MISSYSSGSTAVTGFLERCGAYTCPPHTRTNDVLTPNPHEPVAYKEALLKLINEVTLEPVGRPADFTRFFEIWWQGECDKAKALGRSHIVLKHALQTFVLPYLNRRLAPKYVFVTRPLKHIEATRVRRKWHPVHGQTGAQAIYQASHNFLIENSCPFISVPFEAFRKDAALRQNVLDYIGLEPTPDALKTAETFIRS